MQLLSVFLMMIYLLQNQCSLVENFDDIESKIRSVLGGYSSVDCSQYANDHEIYTSFPFLVKFNSSSNNVAQTYGRKNNRGHVEYLNVADEKYLPSSVFCLRELQQLHVHHTKFQGLPHRLPAAIDHLALSLTHLRIRDTPIAYLPETIGKLKRLESLVLSNVNLRSLPSSIGLLSSLEYLDLRENCLTTLPSTITKMSSLDTLVLDGNKQLRSVQTLHGQPHLTTLHTDNCPIVRIPINLPRLRNLYMANNSLTGLDGIETLGNGTADPKIFHFYKNSIRYVTPDIQRVRNLQRLNLDQNKLRSLPLSIFKVSALEYLSIKHNYFGNVDLKALVAVFNMTHPTLKLDYSPQKRA